MKPVLSVQNGRIEPVDKVRTFSKAQDRMLELFLKEAERLGPPYHIAAMHTDTPDEAQVLLERACHGLHSDQVVDAFVGRVSPVLGVHTGPGALGIALMAGM
jgi:fatty acid-binding protein DegV